LTLKEQIDNAKKSLEFGQEFEPQYLGLVGTVSSLQSIDILPKHVYNPELWRETVKTTIGLDPSFGSSNFGIVATQLYYTFFPLATYKLNLVSCSAWLN
jgi:hypothetical protein